MCGRYSLFITQDIPALASMLSMAVQNSPFALEPGQEAKTGEIFPSDIVPVLVKGAKGRRPVLMQWGVPHWATPKKLLINARAESRSSPFWAEAFETRRCLVPGTGFYEWQHGGEHDKQKYHFTVPQRPALLMAGIYTNTTDAEGHIKSHFAIVTTQPSASMFGIHDRMPVILHANEADRWLSGDYASLLSRDGFVLEKDAL
ncbi:MAG: SOS response-associated peptidase [Oscillospiraceae bacterium]